MTDETGAPRVQVLIVNDSPTVRASLRQALTAAEGLAVVGEASGGRDALEMVTRLRPDLVLLDVVMHGMDGYATTRAIMASAPTPIVLMSGVVDTHDVATAMEALRAGALSIVEQLPPPRDPDHVRRRDALARLCRAMSRVRVGAARPALPRAPTPPPSPSIDGAIAAIGIVASAGGPPALAELLAALPPRAMPPILVVQHIAEGFVEGFASWLGTSTGHDVRVATPGAGRAEKGTVWVAPHGTHLRLDGDLTLVLDERPADALFRPSGTELLRSLAPFGAAAVGIVLTGMGSDGADGAVVLADAGGTILAQDEASAAVWGMPQAVARRGCVQVALRPAGLASWLVERVAPRPR